MYRARSSALTTWATLLAQPDATVARRADTEVDRDPAVVAAGVRPGK
jgi:hypothetical protein